MKSFLIIIVFFLAGNVFASDWGGSVAPIDAIYIYTNSVIVVQGAIYKGKANCEENNKWSFRWDELDPKVADRAYSALLAAYMSKTPIRPIFDSVDCGPERAKKFTGNLVFQ